MKLYRNVMFLCIAACACTKVGSEPEISSVYTVRASVSQPECDTKVSLDQNMVKWTAGDQITVLDDNSGRYTFDLTSGDGQTSGTFNYTGSLTGNVSCAVYPAGENLKTVDVDGSGNLVFKYDCSEMATQTYKFFNNHNLMVGKCDGGSINFKNAFGLLKLNATTGNEAIGDIIVTSLDPDDKLWGEASITMAADGSIVGVEMTNDSPYANQIVYHCVSWPANKTASIYLLVPDGCLEDGFAVTFFDTGDRYIRTVTAPDGNAITRSKVLNMPVLTLDKHTPAQDGLTMTDSSVITDAANNKIIPSLIYPNAEDCTIKARFSTPVLNNCGSDNHIDPNGRCYRIFGARAGGSSAGSQLLTFATNGTSASGYRNSFYTKFMNKSLVLKSGETPVVTSPEDIVDVSLSIKKEQDNTYSAYETMAINDGTPAEYELTGQSLTSEWNSNGSAICKQNLSIGEFINGSVAGLSYGKPRIFSIDYQEGGVSIHKYSAKMLSCGGIDIYPVMTYNDGETGYFRKFLR